MPKIGARARPPIAEVKSKVAAELSISDKATKRVIAPFVRIVRKGQKLHEVEETKQFSYFLQKKPSVLIRDLSSFLSDSVDLASLLHETADVLKLVTKGAGVTLYMMDPATKEIYQSKKAPVSDRFKIKWKIKEGTTVAAHVAYKKEYVIVDDIIEDQRFPQGLGYQTDAIKSVLAIPVVTPDGECFAVIELYKLLFDTPFTDIDLKIALIMTGWMGAAIHQNSRRLALQRQQELNDYLLDLTKCFLGESVVMEKLVCEIIKFARITMNAERGMIFLLNVEDESVQDDLVADVFDEGLEEAKEGGYKKPQKVRFTKERGIAGLVARTGVAINVKDAYEDSRFNKEVDQKTGFITRSILCMPIIGKDAKILGVAQLLNKRYGGYFNSTDESLFRTFCTYCSLAITYSKMQQNKSSTLLLNNIFVKTLKLQMKPCIHDLQAEFAKKKLKFQIPIDFHKFHWYIPDEGYSKMPELILHMFLNLTKRGWLDVDKTIEFILSVRKFYRKNPYHNFEHAFHVCHSVFLMLKSNIKRFSQIEIVALLIAAICHDVDHTGFTNEFLYESKHDLSYIYAHSYLESHHFYITTLLLETTNIFTKISPEDFQTLKREIRFAIMSTNLQNYFFNKLGLQKTLEGTFNWDDPTHKAQLKGVMMLAADYTITSKPFLIAKQVSDKFFAELYRQGDAERQMGLCPLSLFDRYQAHRMPEDQVNFLNIIMLPCLDILRKTLPYTDDIYNGAKSTKQTWIDIINVRGKKCWRQDDSLVVEKHIE